ncbi:MAG TPA: MBL fold metallo-hydrolase [Syntrophorhabdaceae bacterium]|nr:MBL fold metallo-hydrolase [Syntrophorhabdaceae bacterium]
MIIHTAGLIKNSFYVCGLSVYPVELFDGVTPVLFDGGITCAGRLYADTIRSVLGKKEPQIAFISHVHWDHCGAVSYLKDAFPSMRLATSPDSKTILQRPNAVQQIQSLNEEVQSIVAAFPEVDASRLIDRKFQPFAIDMELKDGEIIDLGGGVTVEALATPGHTRDHMSFYIPEKKALIASEACGCLDGTDAVVVQFLTDYDLYLSSLKRLAELPAEILCQGHRLVFVGRDEVRTFFDRSIKATIEFKDRVDELLEQEDRSLEKVVMQIKAEQYDTNTGIKQPEVPYLLNLRAQVKHLAVRAGSPGLKEM